MTKRRYLKRANGVNCTLDTMASQDEMRIVAGDEGEDELDASISDSNSSLMRQITGEYALALSRT